MTLLVNPNYNMFTGFPDFTINKLQSVQNKLVKKRYLTIQNIFKDVHCNEGSVPTYKILIYELQFIPKSQFILGHLAPKINCLGVNYFPMYLYIVVTKWETDNL